MGNICSKSSNKDDNFSGEGRVVGIPSPTSTSAPVPQKITTNSPGRPLGGGSSGSDGATDARSAAARAAEERAKNSAPRGTSGGPLAAKLIAQQKQTRSEWLAAGSKEEQAARAADEAREVGRYN